MNEQKKKIVKSIPAEEVKLPLVEERQPLTKVDRYGYTQSRESLEQYRKDYTAFCEKNKCYQFPWAFFEIIPVIISKLKSNRPAAILLLLKIYQWTAYHQLDYEYRKLTLGILVKSTRQSTSTVQCWLEELEELRVIRKGYTEEGEKLGVPRCYSINFQTLIDFYEETKS